MAGVWPLFCVFLLFVSSLLPPSRSSYAGSASSIINPAKVKQISWKPRSYRYPTRMFFLPLMFSFVIGYKEIALIKLTLPSRLRRTLVSTGLLIMEYSIRAFFSTKAFVYEGFLTELECDHLISLAQLELKRSAVADHESGESKLSEVRTSSGMFIQKGKDPIISGIEDRIASWTFLPKENGEDIQVLRYEEGQKYEPHYDYFSDKVNIARGGHRIATVLMYLTDVAKGGETVFPSAEEPLRRKASEVNDLSDCAKKGIAAKPRRGDALLFFSLHPTAQPDISSLHGGCPVLEGEKWSATKWIHVDSFDRKVGDSGNCSDLNESCERWAALGECSKNPEYMVGSADLPGYCRKSCKTC